MSEDADKYELIDPKIMGRWIYDYYGIWQLSFINDNELGRISSDRGLMSLSLGDDIKHLWQLGLLRADLIRSDHILEVEGLDFIATDDEGNHYYADTRIARIFPTGLGGVISALPTLPTDLELLFHPFRYYVVYQIDRILRTNIHPMQMLQSIERFPSLLEKIIVEFNRWTQTQSFTFLFDGWNNIVTLAVAVEPVTFRRLFNTIRRPAHMANEEYQRLLSEYWEKLRTELIRLEISTLERVRDNLCTNTSIIEPNSNMLTILRFTEGEARLRTVRGRLGGAVYLNTMAEMIRRSAEEVFGIRLPEEDEIGLGNVRARIKQQQYGTDRLLDGDDRAKNEFLRKLGLDYGVRLRWYVEGETEYNALESILGELSGIELINLRGNVAAKGGRGLAFRDSLLTDIRSGIFSFISIDGDRSDFLRAARKAAEDDEICGLIFISNPDFEFGNFDLIDLESVLWQIALENGAEPQEREKLNQVISKCTTGSELLREAKRAIGALSHIDKGKLWGERLMKYAWEARATIEDIEYARKEKITEAVNLAIRAISYDYLYHRNRYRTDPNSGRFISRDTAANAAG